MAFLWPVLSAVQIGFGNLAATSTANIVAVLRTLPAIVISASVMGVCCSASPSGLFLTLAFRSRTSRPVKLSSPTRLTSRVPHTARKYSGSLRQTSEREDREQAVVGGADGEAGFKAHLWHGPRFSKSEKQNIHGRGSHVWQIRPDMGHPSVG